MEQKDLIPIYYVKCANFTPEFVDTGSYKYSVIRMCEWKRKLDVITEEDAEKIANEMNSTGFCCPVCGMKGKIQARTNFEICNENRLLHRMNYMSLHSR